MVRGEGWGGEGVRWRMVKEGVWGGWVKGNDGRRCTPRDTVGKLLFIG